MDAAPARSAAPAEAHEKKRPAASSGPCKSFEKDVVGIVGPYRFCF